MPALWDGNAMPGAKSSNDPYDCVGQWKKGAIPPLWGRKAVERIVGELERLLLAL
ncbi:MAG: hypothetical protein KF722_06895 [Nitrospira sp.]|nr:hypothetical protein [Nitrospira sp.]